MVELFAAGFRQTPRLVCTPILRVTTQQLPTLATLHRPPLAESGPVDGIYTRFACDGLKQQWLLQVFQSRPHSKEVSDRISGLLVHVGASALQMQHAPANGLL
jgi:hypothetical protein